MTVQIIAEVGINHNGNLDLALELIDFAFKAGCDAVKFQKRTVDVVYTPEELARPRESPFGTTNGDLKRSLEFGEREYQAINKHCFKLNMPWTASCWDEGALEFIASFNPPFFKIASACLTDDGLLKAHRQYGKPIVLSTGGSTLEQIDHAVKVLGTSALTLLHCNSTYPADCHELNLLCIETLRTRYRLPVGYSGHETGIATTVATVAMGATVIERHITLDRATNLSGWSGDHAASLGPKGLRQLVEEIRNVEAAMGDGVKRVWASEVPVMKKLRRVCTVP